ncbi:hypothetical protein V2J09_014051 [Rumex salicifolius]
MHAYIFWKCLQIEEAVDKRSCKEVNVMKVNGAIPGPVLNLTRGQTVTVNVINNASYGFTLHWFYVVKRYRHGVKQPRNPWSDGPEYITQCPIQPGKNFTYEIILSDEEGTLWWHAHSDWSRATIHGAIFIHPDQGRQYPFSVQPDAEQEIILGTCVRTWFDRDVMDIIKDYLQNGTDLPLDFDTFTMNGLPGYQVYTDERGCTPGMFEMEVESGKTYLLRIINAAMNEDMVFKVRDHNLTVVGTDGAYIEPIATDNIMISPGQTMDALLVANQLPGYYYMGATYHGFEAANPTYGLIKYKSNDTTRSGYPALPDTINVANFTNRFRALNNTNYTTQVPQTVDTRLLMTVSLNRDQPCTAAQNCTIQGGASLSNISFVPPQVDVLQAYYLNMTGVYRPDFPEKPPVFDYTNVNGTVGVYSEVNGTRVFAVDYNSTVEIVFQGTNIVIPDGLAHPMHVHGYSFYNVASGYGNYNETTAEYNLVDPPLINTVALPAKGWVAIRFRANNPGVWFMHCHLDRHAYEGMDAVMIVRNGTTTDTSILPPPYTLTGTCG